jgi:cytochrome c biogenesis protein CcdA
MTETSLSLGLALLAGLLTVISPCVLPVLPIVVGRALQSHRYGPVALVSGLIAGFAIVGSLLGISSSGLTSATSLLRDAAIGLLLAMGILSIFPRLSYQLFSYLPIKSLPMPAQTGLIGEFWLGTQLGLLWTPCAGPVLGSILILAAVKHQVWSALTLLTVYGVGAGIPILVIAYTSRRFSHSLQCLRVHSSMLQRVGGLMIVVTAFAILLGWDVKLQLLLAPLFPASPL